MSLGALSPLQSPALCSLLNIYGVLTANSCFPFTHNPKAPRPAPPPAQSIFPWLCVFTPGGPAQRPGRTLPTGGLSILTVSARPPALRVFSLCNAPWCSMVCVPHAQHCWGLGSSCCPRSARSWTRQPPSHSSQVETQVGAGRFLTTQQWGLGSPSILTLAPALSAQGCPLGPSDKGMFPSWLFSREKSHVWGREGLTGERGDGLFFFPGRE